MNKPTENASRRSFLRTSAAGSLASLLLTSRGLADEKETPSPEGPPPDLPREVESQQADMGSLYPQVHALAETGEYPNSFLSGRFKSLEDFKAAGREKVQAAFAYQPEKVEPRAEIVQRDEFGDFVREKILFSTSSDFRVPAYLHIPKGIKGSAPAIVDLHSHGGMFLFGKEKVIDFGKNHPVMTAYHQRNYGGRPTTTELVRRGYAVITIDALMFGERRLILDDDLKHGWDRSQYTVEVADHLNRKCRGKEATLAKSMTYAGTTWPGIITWDDMRTVDYLVTRP